MTFLPGTPTKEKIAALEAEIERLRADNERLVAVLDRLRVAQRDVLLDIADFTRARAALEGK